MKPDDTAIIVLKYVFLAVKLCCLYMRHIQGQGQFKHSNLYKCVYNRVFEH